MSRQHTAYAENEQMAIHRTWLVHNDSHGETSVLGFILEAVDDIHTIELTYDTDGTIQC